MSVTFRTLFLLLFSCTLFAGSENNTTATSKDAESSRVTQTTYASDNDDNSTITSYVVTADDNSTETTYLVGSDSNVTKISKPLNGDISITYEGQVYNCDKEDLITEDMNGTKVYHCPTVETKQLESSTDERGTAETARLTAEVQAAVEGVKRVVLIENNESGDGKIWVPLYYTEQVVKTVFPARIYLSLRYGAQYEEGEFSLVDGGTRGGFFYYHQFENELELTYHFEAGVTFSGLDQIVGTDTQSGHIGITPRLNVFSLKKDFVTAIVGKYWSTYYDIAGMTDKFIVYGAQGTGVYNAGTDGGGSGTGRASDMLQLRFSRSDFNLGLQVQDHQFNVGLGVDVNYDYCFGGSLFYKGLSSGVKVGVAMNYGRFDDLSEMALLGVDGNDHAYVGGLSYQKGDLSLDFTAAYTQNHVTDNEGFYFTSIGSELYARYQLLESLRFAFGYNHLRPVDNDYRGDYDVKDIIASLQYTFDKNYDTMVYAEGRYSRGRQADGSKTPSVITVGFHFLLDY